jgi:hypothetical protein
VYSKREFTTVKSHNCWGNYYTVLNTNLDTHIHVNELKTAKILIFHAIKYQKGVKNIKLNRWMLSKIDILLGNNKEWINSHSLALKEE